MFVEVFSTALFFLAILHVFFTSYFRKKEQKAEGTSIGSLYAFMGNVTLIFGFWLVPIFLVKTIYEGFETSYQTLASVNLLEPFSYFVLLSITSIQPIRNLFSAVMNRLFGRQLFFFWIGIILFSSALAGIFSGVPIMGLTCWFLSVAFFKLKPSMKLSYCTLALLLISISAGTTILPFNFSFQMSAVHGNYSHLDLFTFFGWKVLVALTFITFTIGYLFRKEFQKLQNKFAKQEKRIKITLRELFYLFLFFLAALGQRQVYVLILVLGIVIIMHKSVYRVKGEEGKLSLYLPIAVAFFTYTLEIHGSLQKWWVLPLFENIQGIKTYFYAFFLTGLNEHVPLEAIKEIIPAASRNTQFFATLGLLAGGGLTIIAKSANIFAKLELRKHFPNKTISPFRHLLVAIPIGLIFSFIVSLLHFLGDY